MAVFNFYTARWPDFICMSAHYKYVKKMMMMTIQTVSVRSSTGVASSLPRSLWSQWKSDLYCRLFYGKYPTEYVSERILKIMKIDQYLEMTASIDKSMVSLFSDSKYTIRCLSHFVFSSVSTISQKFAEQFYASCR